MAKVTRTKKTSVTVAKKTAIAKKTAEKKKKQTKKIKGNCFVLMPFREPFNTITVTLFARRLLPLA